MPARNLGVKWNILKIKCFFFKRSFYLKRTSSGEGAIDFAIFGRPFKNLYIKNRHKMQIKNLLVFEKAKHSIKIVSYDNKTIYLVKFIFDSDKKWNICFP